MRYYIAVVSALVLLLLAAFAIVEATGIPLLTDPSPQLRGAGPGIAAATGIGLLVADVVLPVPSSLVMVIHGALFGAVLGALLSLIGSVGAALVGFAIGRGGGPLIARLVPSAEQERADRMFARWGTLAIVLTRPVPLLAETTAIMAGAARTMSWLRLTLAALVGGVPAAILYAVAGAIASGFDSLPLVFAVVLGVAAATWLVERAITRGGARRRDAATGTAVS